MPGAKLLVACGDGPPKVPFVDAIGAGKRMEAKILADPAVHAVQIRPRRDLKADRAIEAGKAKLCTKLAGRGSADMARLVETVARTGL